MVKRIIALLWGAMLAFTVSAQNFNPVINDILRSYMPWESAEFSGKLKSDLLPLSPTVKIYMEHDSLLQLSLRAPLVGEVGRLSITPQEMICVNKMKRVYCRESSANLMEMYPSLITDLQNILLARVTLLGEGGLSEATAEKFDVDEDGEGHWLLLPQTDPGVVPFNYGYIVGANSRTLVMMATIAGKGSLEVTYSYPGNGMTMKFDVMKKGKSKAVSGALEFNSVKWGGTKMPDIKLGSYDKVSLKDFFANLK